MARICPRCNTGLEPRGVTGNTFAITVDDCKDCEGLFLDRGELGRLAPDSTSVEELASQLSREPEASNHNVKCPHCASQMHLTSIAELEVQFDVCGGCQGIWLDRHELEALQKASGKTEATESTDAGAGWVLFGDILAGLASLL